jgi:outer membrane protein assembly factor BamD (BamD/ComL family)
MRTLAIIFFSLLLASCSRKTPQELYGEGTRAIDAKEFRIAADRFEEILSRHTQEAVAESAMYRVALLYNNELHDIPKAIDYYERYHDTYSSSDHAPTALFLAGFLLNNEQHDTARAKAAYQKFLERYPRHDLASSARFELDNLGRDPGALAPASGKDSAVSRTRP